MFFSLQNVSVYLYLFFITLIKNTYYPNNLSGGRIKLTFQNDIKLFIRILEAVLFKCERRVRGLEVDGSEC